MIRAVEEGYCLVEQHEHMTKQTQNTVKNAKLTGYQTLASSILQAGPASEGLVATARGPGQLSLTACSMDATSFSTAEGSVGSL